MDTAIQNSFTAVRWAAIDWLFPPECVGCGKPGTQWCDDCRSGLHRVQAMACPVCGTPSQQSALCADCRREPPAFDWVRSWAEYDDGMRRVIHSLKYGNNVSLAQPLGQALAQLYAHSPWTADAVTVVPMSRERRRARGYNQAALIARAFCRQTGLPFQSALLKRIRQTASQVGKSRSERMQNVQSAFSASPRWADGKTILVIDDVYTTGATLRSCAHALKAAGALAVIGLTAARAGLAQDDPPLHGAESIDSAWAF